MFRRNERRACRFEKLECLRVVCVCVFSLLETRCLVAIRNWEKKKYIFLNQLGFNDQSIVMQDQLDGIVQ